MLRLVSAPDPADETGSRVGEDDEQLVALARRGELAAFDELVRRHQSVAYRTARIVVGADDAQDVAQDAFVKAYRGLAGFREGSPFRPWLLAIVTNVARDHRRSAGRRLAAVARLGGRRWSEPEPDELALAAAGRRQLLDALRTLPENDQLVLHCRYLLDLSEAETAQVLHIPLGTVKSRLSRAMNRLRDRLAGGGMQ
ncbi:MAG: sigma-70 family RNA polymerase sigma factor [Actinomycetota bacterium]